MVPGGDQMAHELSYPEQNRLAELWGHFAPELLSIAILGVIALGLHPLGGPLLVTVPLALLVFVIGSWLMMRRHDRQLCELCVASLPLNASERATRYQRRFWLAHHGAQPRIFVPYLAVLIGSNFVPGTYGRVFWALVQLSMVYLIMANSTHRRLQPWCPRCSGGGGADAPDPVMPDPPPGHRRQLV